VIGESGTICAATRRDQLFASIASTTGADTVATTVPARRSSLRDHHDAQSKDPSSVQDVNGDIASRTAVRASPVASRLTFTRIVSNIRTIPSPT
jgi:hypothetical protein